MRARFFAKRKRKTYNIFMQPILTADSFSPNLGHSQFQLACAGFYNAVKTADESVKM
jgi:hypothetical protein